MKKILEQLLALLRVRSQAAGLEVGDEMLRLVAFDGKTWQLHAIRLEPGILQDGKIKNRAAFIESLAALKAKLSGRPSKKKVNVVLCLNAIPTYTQVFTLPSVTKENLDEAAELNLRAASPLEASESYSDWELAGRDEKTGQMQILSAFVERKPVDEMVDALYEAGFLAMAAESRALALARMLREKGAGVQIGKAYVFVNIDNVGIDFLIIRNGALYFEYTKPWRDIADEKGEISAAKFEEAFAASIRQVVNFYSQRWPEPMGAIILSAMALGDEAQKAIMDVVSVPAVRLTLIMGQPISSEWLTALGCSLRGAQFESGRREISLLGDDLRGRFHEEQLLHFMQFWRILVPVTLSLLVLTFVVADVFVTNSRSEIESHSNFKLSAEEPSGTTALQGQADAFNQSVSLLAATEQMMVPKSPMLEDILGLAAVNHITVNQISFQSFGVPINLSGAASSESAILAFKSALEADKNVSDLNLPLTGIQSNATGFAFSLSFSYAPPPPPSEP